MFRQRTSAAIFAVITSLALPAASVLAQDAPPSAASPTSSVRHRLQAKFEAANTTHDGYLTLSQAQAGNMPMVARNFSAIDADRKGYVTLEDIHRFIQARRASRQQGQTTAVPPT